MDKNQILEILNDWNFWRKEIDTGITREGYLDLCQKFLKPNVALAIIGVRRSGKSCLMKQLAKELISKGVDKKDILFINFEDKRFTDVDNKFLQKIYEVYLEQMKPKNKPYLFLDEINKVPEWERFVRTFHELNNAKIIVSGSSAKLLKGELATLLTGRHLDIVVFPLSFKEYLYFKNLVVKDELDIISKRIEIKRHFSEYLEEGGFPEAVLNQEKKQLLLTYFDDIITKDIEQRYHIKESEKLRSLARFYLTNISNPVSFNSLKSSLRLSTGTIDKFSAYMEEANLLFFLKRFSYQVKEQDKSPRKVYSVDVGLARTVGFMFAKNLGTAFENLTALKLKRDLSINLGLEIFYWKDPQGHEVDFVVKEGLKVSQLIQVCYNLENTKTKEREIRALLKASEELRCNDLLIITEDYEGEENAEWFGMKGKIKFIPLWKWLLL